MNGDLRPEILFQSWQANPKVFLHQGNRVSFVVNKLTADLTTIDSVYRIDLRHVGELYNANAAAEAVEPIPDFHNYYLAHCANGVLNVHGYKRVVYTDIYPGIDFHVYSNPWGLKFYYVIHPGAEPDNILLQFNGQDSLHIDYYGGLRMYLEEEFIRLPNAIAYQQIGTTTTLVPWGLNYQIIGGNDLVGFNFGSYDPAYPLVVDISQSMPPPEASSAIPEWSTFDGDAEVERCEEVVTFGTNMLATCGQTFGQNFPLSAGATDNLFLGVTEAYFSVFNDQYSRIYTSFVGGDGYDTGKSIAITSNGQYAYLLGGTSSSMGSFLTVWTGNQYHDDTHATGADECFIARIAIPQGTVDYRTRFGMDQTFPGKIRLDKDGSLYICGQVNNQFGTTFVGQNPCGGTNNSFPFCNTLGTSAYFQNYHAGGGTSASRYDGFYAKFNPDLSLAVSSLFGGHGQDVVSDLIVDDDQEQFFLVGETSSPREVYTNCAPPLPGYLGFPLCNGGSGYFQSDLNGNNTTATGDACAAAMSFNGLLRWSTFIGSAQADYAHAGVYKAPGAGAARLYVVGGTHADQYGVNCTVPANGGFPRCANGPQLLDPPAGGREGFAMHFNTVNYALGWSTLITGGADDRCYDVTLDNLGNTFIGGETKSGCGGTVSVPILNEPDHYRQEIHADDGQSICQNDGFILGVDATDALFYGSFWGGIGGESIATISVTQPGERLYIAGNSYSTAAYPFFCPPTVNPYCLTYPAWPYTDEIFYAQIQYDLTTQVEESPPATNAALRLYPNPATDLITVYLSGLEGNAPIGLELRDALGRQVARSTLPGRDGPQALTLGELANGMYTVLITDPNQQVRLSTLLILQR